MANKEISVPIGECPMHECRHMREVKNQLRYQCILLWTSIGLGLVSVWQGVVI